MFHKNHLYVVPFHLRKMLQDQQRQSIVLVEF